MFHARKSLSLFALVILALLASACSSLQASPTPSLQEMQLTAQAAAMTLTAQAPTATPVTPSPTPIPTIVTIEPVVVVPPSPAAPQQAVLPQPVVVVPPAASTDEKKEQDCTGAISAGTEGPRAPVRIVNKKGASILLSYYLEPSDFGQCGSGSVSLDGGNKSLNLPRGCYWLYAWVTYQGKDQSFQGYSCNPKGGTTWYIYPDRMEEALN